MIGVSVVSMLLKIDPIPCGLLMGLVEQILKVSQKITRGSSDTTARYSPLAVHARYESRACRCPDNGKTKRVIAAAKTLESLQRSILRGTLLEGTMVFLQ